MKKSALVQNYKNTGVPGVNLMDEQNSFFASKMMDIEDIIDITFTITPKDLQQYKIYTDTAPINNNPTMAKFLEEKSKYSYDDIKFEHIELSEDDSQQLDNKDYNTKWKFTLDSKSLLREYLYDEFFIHVKNNDFKEIETAYPDLVITDLVKDYIDINIMNRYKFKSFRLYTTYHRLDEKTVPAVAPAFLSHKGLDKDVDLFIKRPVFDIKGIAGDMNNIEPISIDEYTDGTVVIYYKQTESSIKYTFLYYFDVIYEKI